MKKEVVEVPKYALRILLESAYICREGMKEAAEEAGREWPDQPGLDYQLVIEDVERALGLRTETGEEAKKVN